MESIETSDKTTNAKGTWPHLTYMRDPESLMGAGMDMRNADFKSAFCDHITIQDSACSGWEVK